MFRAQSDNRAQLCIQDFQPLDAVFAILVQLPLDAQLARATMATPQPQEQTMLSGSMTGSMRGKEGGR